MAKVGSAAKKRTRFKNPRDPLVTFDRERLLEAVLASSRTPAALATRRVPRQTLSNLLSQKQPRCHRSSLEEISTILNVDLKWLTGDQEFLPGAPYRSVAESQFVIRCWAAYQRDTRRCRYERARARREQRIGDFLYAILALLDQKNWWRALYSPAPTPNGDKALALAIVTALSVVLKPWFDGKVSLDYEKIIQLANGKVARKVELRGIEPLTSAVRSQHSTN